MSDANKGFDRSKLLCMKSLPSTQSYKPFKARKFQNIQQNQNESKKEVFDDCQAETIRKIESSPPTFRICSCERTQKKSIKGFRINFQFNTPSGEQYHAKIKPRQDSSSIGISKGTESHINSSSFLGVVLFTNDFCDCSLRIGEKYGKEACTIQFRKNVPDVPRDINIFLFDQGSTLPAKLISKEPELVNGSWFVDLNSDNAVASIKNCVLCDEKGMSYIVVRKISKDKLEIEAHRDLSDLILFSVCISSFLCKE